MAKPKRDPVREERIHNEVVVDAYGREEQAMGWYYYLEDKIPFPLQATCIAAKAVSPLLKGETVEVQGMAPEEACASDMVVLIKWQGRTMGVPLSQLQAVKANQPTNPSLTGITGWPKATVSNPLPNQPPIYAAPPKAHVATSGAPLYGRY